MTTPALTETAVLRRWDRGQTSIKIGNDLNMRPSYVRVIVQRARAHGDERAHRRMPGRVKGVPISLNRTLTVKLAEEADRRDMSERELATSILATVLSGNLIDAVLDDGEDA
jgi:hypothetical protein